MNTRLNKKVKKDLDAYFKGFRGSDPEVHHGLKHILIGALTDANFHSEAKKVQNMFPKANKSKYAGRTDWEDSIEMNHGVPIAKSAKWDGYEIIDAISYWASMFIGGPVGSKITSLKEGMNENIRMFVNKFINEVTHSHEYEDMSSMGEDENDKEEIRIGNYQTKYFHMCPGASSLYGDIESKGVDMDMAERSVRLQDALYFIEEHIQRGGYKPERDYVMVAKNIAKNIMKMASMMGLEKEHSYIQGHVDTIIKTVKERNQSQLGEKATELTEKNVPTDPAKWAASKAAAKRKFDVYPSAYANAWAAKNYKGKGGGWRKSESVNEGIEPQIKKIAYFTGTRPEAVEDFVSKHSLNITKLLKYVQKGGLPQRMELVSALAGRDGNSTQKKVIKMFSESVNEGKDDFVARSGKADIFLKKGYKHHNEDELTDLYSKLGKLVKGLNVKKIDLVFESKVHFDKKLKNGNIFQVIDRDVKGMKRPEKEDKFLMQIVDKNGKVVKHIGSHPSLSGAKKYSKSVNEAKEPEVITTLRKIVKNKQNDLIKDTKSGKKVRVDMNSANLMVQVYDALKQSNKDKFVKSGIVMMGHMAYKLMKKENTSEVIEEAEYQGRKVELNKPMQGDSKKFKVYVKNAKGNVVVVHFGQKGMNIKKNNPKARKSFRARMNCDNPGPKWKANYWSCKKW